MNQHDLISVLEQKLLNNNISKPRILINGNWGIGKSYCWDAFCKLVETKNKLNQKQKKMKTIKISLFGIDSISSLDKRLKIAYTKTDNKFGTVVQQAFEAANKKFAGGAFDPLAFITLDENCIICFDDLERKSDKISIKDVMGYIEDTAQICRIVLITNESMLNENDKRDYSDYKEKLIDFEYSLTDISDSVIDEFIKDTNTDKENQVVVKDIFKKFGRANLRTLFKIKNLINELSHKFKRLDSELVKLCCAVIIVEYTNEGRNTEVNTILKYRDFNIKVSALGLETEVLGFLKQNKIDQNRVALYLNPKERLEVDILQDALFEVYLHDEKYLVETVDKAITFINDKKGPYLLVEYILRIVGFIKWYYVLFDLSLSGEQLQTMEKNAVDIIRNIIENTDEIHIAELRIKHDQAGIAHLHPYIENLIKGALQDFTSTIEKRVLQFVDDKFANADYYECFKKLSDNPDLIKNRIHMYDTLLLQPSMDYFSAISEFTKVVDRHQQLKGLVENKLEQLKKATDDKVKLRRIDEIIKYLN